MPPGHTDAIISIRPEYAEAILSGNKTVELRRRIPAITCGTRLWIYATLPVGAIIGTAVVKRIDRDTPAKIWRDWREQAGVTHGRFKDYFEGAPEAVALVLYKAQRTVPVSMSALRRRWKDFHPPQVMTRLSPSETKSLAILGRVAA